ncbi:hypothetical protein NUQ38_02375, partial [Glaesserella parasuis]|nr:hypothetical protein [Glaesserella parasuis]
VLMTSLRKARGEGKTAKKKAKAEKPVFKEVKIKNARTKSINRKSSKSKY